MVSHREKVDCCFALAFGSTASFEEQTSLRFLAFQAMNLWALRGRLSATKPPKQVQRLWLGEQFTQSFDALRVYSIAPVSFVFDPTSNDECIGNVRDFFDVLVCYS